MSGLDAPTLIARLVTLVIAFTVHEFSHAWTAVELGDDTPRRMGRLTLNPLAHLDFFGSLVLVVSGFGWAKPVPVNPYNFRNGPRLGMAIVAVAGPFSNLIMALLAAIPFRLGLLRLSEIFHSGQFLPSPASFLSEFILINLTLLFFNLIPIAPLDGSKVLRGLAPSEWDSWLLPLEQWGPFILIGLVFLGSSLLGMIISPPTIFLYRQLLGF
jgi:Zn-dependent protease